jgi:anthranilate synthase component II
MSYNKKILVFDNYDSFTYNLVHMVEKVVGVTVDVHRNDAIALADINKYDKIILSPGPGIPEEAGILLDVIKHYAATKSILGVCLGHQAIGESFGGGLNNLSQVYHGVATPITLTYNESYIFNGLPKSFVVGRYHSWVVDANNFPNDLLVTATDANGYIMAVQHKTLDVVGVQFHPESVLTPVGEQIITNWLKN